MGIGCPPGLPTVRSGGGFERGIGVVQDEADRVTGRAIMVAIATSSCRYPAERNKRRAQQADRSSGCRTPATIGELRSGGLLTASGTAVASRLPPTRIGAGLGATGLPGAGNEAGQILAYLKACCRERTRRGWYVVARTPLVRRPRAGGPTGRETTEVDECRPSNAPSASCCSRPRASWTGTCAKSTAKSQSAPPKRPSPSDPISPTTPSRRGPLPAGGTRPDAPDGGRRGVARRSRRPYRRPRGGRAAGNGGGRTLTHLRTAPGWTRDRPPVVAGLAGGVRDP